MIRSFEIFSFQNAIRDGSKHFLNKYTHCSQLVEVLTSMLMLGGFGGGPWYGARTGVVVSWISSGEKIKHKELMMVIVIMTRMVVRERRV